MAEIAAFINMLLLVKFNVNLCAVFMLLFSNHCIQFVMLNNIRTFYIFTCNFSMSTEHSC